MLLTNYKTANLFHQTPEMNANPLTFSISRSLLLSFRLFLLFIVID